MEPWCDSVHAGSRGASFPGGQRQRDTDHDHGLPLSFTTTYLRGEQGVSQPRRQPSSQSHLDPLVMIIRGEKGQTLLRWGDGSDEWSRGMLNQRFFSGFETGEKND